LLHDLYHAKERLYDIWDSHITRAEAKIAYLVWKDSVPVGILGYFYDLGRAIGNRHKEVFNYFGNKITNANTKSANNHIKSIARQSSGYSVEVLKAKVLFTNAKHKVKKKSFKSVIREEALGYGLPNSDEINNYDEPHIKNL
jgi:transposase